jgi:SNF2 family DNA or RNA helicase
MENYFDKKVIVTNYTTFRLSNEYYHIIKQKIKKKKKDGTKLPKVKAGGAYIDFSKWGKPEELFIILDEGQSIKNYDSQQSQSLHYHKKYFDYRGVLSGSLGYKVLDYYSICKFLIPETIPYSYSEFRDYLTVRDSYGKTVKPVKVKEFKEKVLNELQISFNKDVLDLPPFIEEEIYIKMNDKMRNLYKSFIDQSVIDLVKKKEQELSGHQLENAFMYLSMFTSDPLLVKDKFNFSWEITDNPKTEIVDSMLDQMINNENKKTIIWCNYPRVINELKLVYKKYDPIVIHGDEKTSVKRLERDKTIQEFRTNNNKHLMICSYVLNSSIDLYEATRQIYWDNITDNDKRDQSKLREWRLGQKEAVKSYYLLFDNSIDIYIYNEILLKKGNVRNLMINKKELTLEDYKAVFNAKAQSYWADY